MTAKTKTATTKAINASHHFDQVSTGGRPVDLPIVRYIAVASLAGVLDEMKRFRHELGAYSPTLAERQLEIIDHFEAALR